ncbi:hypothetical protein FQN60_004433 [Etheostoma spectabile]|uniref:Uncharacterized protein n=1 Tax=Etheostoma spectabile TaxID=54343 RepID=A0A5J5CX55_9PERO|nr:hypothetical protein FQN60_004433 [Etheostoma spectabile]
MTTPSCLDPLEGTRPLKIPRTAMTYGLICPKAPEPITFQSLRLESSTNCAIVHWRNKLLVLSTRVQTSTDLGRIHWDRRDLHPRPRHVVSHSQSPDEQEVAPGPQEPPDVAQGPGEGSQVRAGTLQTTCCRNGVQSMLQPPSSWSQLLSSCLLTSRKSVRSTLLKTSQPLITWYKLGPEPTSTSSSPRTSPGDIRSRIKSLVAGCHVRHSILCSLFFHPPVVLVTCLGDQHWSQTPLDLEKLSKHTMQNSLSSSDESGIFCFFGESGRTAVSLLLLPFVLCFLGPASGCGRMDTAEEVVSVAEEDGSGSDTTRVTGDDALTGMEDAVVASLGGGVVEEDGTSGVPAGGIGRSGTKDGAKSPSLKIFLLKGQIPHGEEPSSPCLEDHKWSLWLLDALSSSCHSSGIPASSGAQIHRDPRAAAYGNSGGGEEDYAMAPAKINPLPRKVGESCWTCCCGNGGLTSSGYLSPGLPIHSGSVMADCWRSVISTPRLIVFLGGSLSL